MCFSLQEQSTSLLIFDPNMVIEKKLIAGDLSSRRILMLPKKSIEKILNTHKITIPHNGLQVQVLDDDKSYTVNLRENNGVYHMGTGWKNIIEAKSLKTGDLVKFYWKDNKFFLFTE